MHYDNPFTTNLSITRAYFNLNTTNLNVIKNITIGNTINVLNIAGFINLPIHLDFSKFKYPLNIITELECKDFELKNFTNINKNIEKIVFINMYMRSIESKYYVGLHKLSSLSIIRNNISVIKNSTFIHLLGLIYLDLPNNNIKYIESSAFIGLNMLYHLQLNHNLIMVLKSNTFNMFESSDLKLYMDNNLLSTIDKNVFGKLNKLELLTIFNNKIECNCQKLNWILHHKIIIHLNSSLNKYIKCYNLKTTFFELLKRSNCSNIKGKYIYIY